MSDMLAEQTPVPLPVNRAPRPSPHERAHLQQLLSHKLRDIPPSHLPDITVEDILHQTEKTRFANVPEDIGLEFLLRHREKIDRVITVLAKGRKTVDDEENNDSKEQTHANIARAIFFYRLSPPHQFQRQHDNTRWNIAMFCALLTQHSLQRETKHLTTPTQTRSDRRRTKPVLPANTQPDLHLSPATLRFITSYLAAVLEHHTTPTVFVARERFVKLWYTCSLDLFTVRQSWAKKALKRALGRLSGEWEEEIEYVRGKMGRCGFEREVGGLVGSLIPGRLVRGGAAWESGGRVASSPLGIALPGAEEVGNRLRDALGVSCAGVAPGESKAVSEEQSVMVCELRIAVSYVQRVRPRDMLTVLMRTFFGRGMKVNLGA